MGRLSGQKVLPRHDNAAMCDFTWRGYPQQVFVATMRSATGQVEMSGIMGYTNQPIMSINDVKPKDIHGHVAWGSEFLQFLRFATDGAPQPIVWGHQRAEVTPVCKVLVNSVEPPPVGEEIRRRYQWLEVQESGAFTLTPPSRGRRPSTLFINPREGLPLACERPPA